MARETETETAVHHYAFSTKPDSDVPVYERTFGTEAAADAWLDRSPQNRFVTVGMVPLQFWY